MHSRWMCFANSAVLTLRGHTILPTVMKELHLVGMAGIALDESSAINAGASYWSFDSMGVEDMAFGFGAGLAVIPHW